MTTSEALNAQIRPAGQPVSKLYRIRLPRKVAARYDRDRSAGHRFVMSLLPDTLGRTARAQTDTLWRVGPHAEHLDVLTCADIAGMGGIAVQPVEAGQQMTLQVVMEAVRAKSSPVHPAVAAELHAAGIRWRDKRSRIADDELPGWIETQLLKSGWQVAEIQTLHRRSVSRRNAAMHLVEFIVEATVVDEEKACTALRKGIGRGRSFGTAMVTAL